MQATPIQTTHEVVVEIEELKALESRSLSLVVTDERSQRQAELFIAEAKAAEKRVESQREAAVRPHLTEQRNINAFYKPVIEAFQKLSRLMTDRLGVYLAEQRRIEQEAQRKAIEEANRKRAEEEAKARTAREEAEAARAAGNEKKAEKLETKADNAEMRAAMTAPQVLPTVTQQTRQLGDGRSISTKDVKDWTYTNGTPRGGRYTREDVQTREIPDAFFVLDEAAIGKIIRAGGKVPGVTMVLRTSTSVRG